MAWQLCPRCDGSGTIYTGWKLITSTTEICDVCHGEKIIHSETGFTPSQQQEIYKFKPDFSNGKESGEDPTKNY